jgi:hypothetical protein
MKHGSSTSKEKTKVLVQLMAWYLAKSTRKKKNKAVTFSCEMHGFIHAAIMPERTAISAEHAWRNKQSFAHVVTNSNSRKVAEILFQHDNFHPHVILRSIEATTKLGWFVSPHPTLQS